ncbi:MAG: hypothetical protein IMY72_11730 [Bacteroidetes bacterium]|nr:hypothetical protein [Bacteroidota bacterium]
MSALTSFERAVLKIIKDNTHLFITEGSVISIDKDKNICNVDRGDLPELLNVRLNSVLEAGTKVITIYPTIGSKVLCAMIENNPTDAFLLSTTDIDEIIINGGENGGLIKISELVDKVNQLEDKMKSHQHLYVNAGGTPTPTTVDVATNPEFVNTVVEDIENEKIKH